MQAKKRVLFFPFNLLSHYLRCIVLANKYYDNEHYEVLFLSSASYNHYVILQGYATFECHQFDAGKVLKCSEKFDFSWLNYTDIETVFLSQVECIRQLKPSIVVGDTAPTLKMATEFTHVKYVSLMNGYMTKYYSYTRRLSRTHKAYKWSDKIPKKYFDRITNFAENLSFKIVHRPFRDLRRKYSLIKVKSYIDEMEGDYNFICDSPELFPQRHLYSNYKFTGPLIYKSENTNEKFINKFNPDKPIIFICMGSSGNWVKLKFLNSPSFVDFTVITAGDTDGILSAPHIYPYSFVNIDEAMKVANLMICHGGNGTIYYGLRHGVYMLCITSHFEQEWNVHALERIGYGKSVNDITEDNWKRIISESLEVKLSPYIK